MTRPSAFERKSRVAFWLVSFVVSIAAASAFADPPPWQRTETRAPCASFNTFRNPYFGDTHVHTTLSFDAVSGDLRARPTDAYAFAKGAPLGLPPYDSMQQPTRSVQLRRPLDFAAVTDHSEFFGEVSVCLVPGLPAYDSSECQVFRNAIPQLTQVASPGIQSFAIPYLVPLVPSRFGFCGPGAVDCLGRASLVWQETQDAAEADYDRTAACTFTTFVGYEWTGNPEVNNIHRNIIFRNDDVPALPTTYVEQPTAQGLWSTVESQCQDSLARCDFLAIPHNSNLSGGRIFAPKNADNSPLTAADAAFRARMEPIAEVFQHKGDSECRTGVLTSDELCGFEKWSSSQIGLPNSNFPPLLFTRNALKEGLVQEEQIGVNPFRFGLIGSTDTHNAAPGLVNEEDWGPAGHLGTRDATPELMLVPLAFGITGGVESNPGGLAVIWAEENSRDALFAAMRRREVYATSGTRPIVRMFAGRYPGAMCDKADFVERGYAGGVPMGGEIGPVTFDHSPRFAVMAFKDPGALGEPSTPLQRIQIVKGWVDGGGAAQEKVFDIAGDASNGASVDTSTCSTSGPSFDSLCTVWKDPEFDRSQRAFYYARIVENPVCRWSTRVCNANGIDCSGPVPPGFGQCCNPAVPKTIQERAWTSPVWYRPEGIARLRGRVSFGNTPGRDVLRVMARTGAVPPGFDLDTQALTVVVSDDDEIYRVTIPPGTLTPRGNRLVYSDGSGSLGGLRRASVTQTRNDELRIAIQTVPMDFASADRSDHMVDVSIEVGDYKATHTRLWTARGDRVVSVRR